MNLRTYEYIAAVGKYRHFGKAALACNISQPALSSQIKKVEEQLGVNIFDRTARRVSVTLAGAQILEQTLEMLQMARKIDDIAALYRSPAAIPICMGMEPSLAPHLFGPFNEAASQIEPETRMLCRERPCDALIAEIDRRIVDFAIVVEPTKPIDYKFTPLLKERILLGVAKTHPLAGRNRLIAEEISNDELIMVGSVCPDKTASGGKAFDASQSCGQRIENILTALHLVKPDYGAVLVPELSRHHINAVRPDMQLIEIEGAQFSRRIGIVSRRGCPREVWLRDLSEQIKRQPHLSLAPSMA